MESSIPLALSPILTGGKNASISPIVNNRSRWRRVSHVLKLFFCGAAHMELERRCGISQRTASARERSRENIPGSVGPKALHPFTGPPTRLSDFYITRDVQLWRCV